MHSRNNCQVKNAVLRIALPQQVYCSSGLYLNHPWNVSISLWRNSVMMMNPLTMPPLESRGRERGMITSLMGGRAPDRDTWPGQMYTLSFVRRFSCPNPPEAEERGQVLSIVYLLKFSHSAVCFFKKKNNLSGILYFYKDWKIMVVAFQIK